MHATSELQVLELTQLFQIKFKVVWNCYSTKYPTLILSILQYLENTAEMQPKFGIMLDLEKARFWPNPDSPPNFGKPLL